MIQARLFIGALAAVAALAQQAAPAGTALPQPLAAIRQSVAENQQRLRHYQWTETTDISVKGEEKKRTQAECQYGPDGKVQKTSIGAAPPPPERRGIRGRIAGKKQAEMKDYVERVRSLLSRYVPPDPQTLQAAFQSGKATLNPATGDLTITDYAKPGDRVTFLFDPAARALRSFSIATYLDEPKDRVTLDGHFSTLPDGTNFLEQSVVDASEKQIRIETTNFDYRKVGG